MRRDIPAILGRIECFPTWMNSWVCPKCKTFHFAVASEVLDGEKVCSCLKCKEVYALDQFRYPEMAKIKAIIRDLAPEIEKEAIRDKDKELEAEAHYGV